MTKNTKKRWSDLCNLPMTEEVIRTLHGAPNLARVSLYRFPPGEDAVGSSQPGRLYVLTGNCVVRNGDELVLEEGDVLEFAGGGYTLRTDSHQGAICVWAWALPEPFRTKVETGRQ
jgi:hypothetical protein